VLTVPPANAEERWQCRRMHPKHDERNESGEHDFHGKIERVHVMMRQSNGGVGGVVLRVRPLERSAQTSTQIVSDCVRKGMARQKRGDGLASGVHPIVASVKHAIISQKVDESPPEKKQKPQRNLRSERWTCQSRT
jgi:hypothetical protein